VAVFEEILVHTKGRWARTPFILAPWQRDEIIRPLFGRQRWDAETGRWVRQYRIAWLELARKNGKSELLAGIALILLCADDEEAAEVYGAARDRDQARKVYDVAERMVLLSPTLRRRLTVRSHEKRIIDDRTGSYYTVIAADAAGNLGHTPHGALLDEVIAQPDRSLWDALRTGMGTRTQPLMVAATTAGNDPTSFAAAEHDYCLRVANHPSLDPTRFVFIRNTPKDADWTDERLWSHANPALGDFLSLQQLRDELREAQANPAAENAFRQFRLNQWVQQATRWLQLAAWDATAGMVVEDQLRGRACYGGLDLASSRDLAALCLDFPDDQGGHDVLWRFWLPSERLQDLDRRTGGQASIWARNGLLTPTEGNVIDHKAILGQLDRDARAFDLAELAFDRWGMTQMSIDLQDAGLTVIPFGQGFSSMSPPTKEFERLVLDGRYRHGGHPVARWMLDNVVVRIDPAGNLKPDRQRSTEKIDGIVAAIMALDRATRHGIRARSAYEDREVEVV
jgi:phage terminase large subunit-like protein